MRHFLLFSCVYCLFLFSCSKDKPGEVRVVNASDSIITMRHSDPATHQTKTLEPDQILERMANGQYCIEYYKAYTIMVNNGAVISKDWKISTNWSEYSLNPGTKDECTVCEFRIENEDL